MNITLIPQQAMFHATTSRGHSAISIRGCDAANGNSLTVFVDAPNGPAAVGGLIREWRQGRNGPVGVFAPGKALLLENAVASNDRVLVHGGRAVVDAPAAPAETGDAMPGRAATAAEAAFTAAAAVSL